MFKIGIVDDRDDQRESFASAVRIKLKKLNEEIDVIDRLPFYYKEEYISWIQENNISVLILDEKLSEEPQNGKAVDYDGHQLGKYLNQFFKNFPLYIVTSFKETTDLEENLKEFFLILSRAEFSINEKHYTNLFVNSGKRFYEEYHLEFSKLTNIAKKIALGTATQKEIAEAQFIQGKLQLPNIASMLNERDIALGELSLRLEKLKQVGGEIKKFLNSRKI